MSVKNSKEELKKNDIKNCTCYYFDDIITYRDFNTDNILLKQKFYEKECENALICDI